LKIKQRGRHCVEENEIIRATGIEKFMVESLLIIMFNNIIKDERKT
jgi:hypothetical protein